MTPQSELSPAQEEHLQEVLAAYLRDVEAGRTPDQAELLTRHPDLAGELQSFFAGQEQIGRLAAPLRQAVELSADVGITGTLGDFRIVREVGRGGMGIVYEAEQISLRRRVALKVLPFAATMDARHLQRFHNEAQAAACLHHTDIVPVYFVGSERGVHFYAMQFIDGQPLSEIIRQMRRLENKEPIAGQDGTVAYQTSPGEAASTPPAAEMTPLTGDRRRGREYYRKVAALGIQAAEALDHAHQLGIVHRDIKPGNLMLDGMGRLWVTDFGLAHMQHGEASLTGTGQMVGTPRYMSPEQALAKRVPIDHRTDVYSLGVTLYELLTLRPAFGSEERQELLRQIAFEEPAKLRRLEGTIPAELEIIVLKTMEKRPQDRYATAQELADDLRHWLNDAPIRARRPTLLQRVAKWMRRHRALARSAVVFLVLDVILLAISTAMIWRANQETKAALARADAKNRWARRAVNDMYEEVAERWLAHEPQMTEVQRQFLLKAMEYYEELACEKSLDPNERLETGIACRRLGVLHDAFPQPGAVNKECERAVVIFEELTNEYPTDVAYRQELARSYRVLGGQLKAHTQYSEGEHYLRKAQSLSADLSEQFPDNPDRQRDLADIQRGLADLFNATDRHLQAEEMISGAVKIYERLAKRFPEEISYQRELTLVYQILAEIKENQRELPDAERICHQALSISEKIRRMDGRASWLSRNVTGGNYNLLADILLERGRLKDAETALRHSLDIRHKLYEDFPSIPAVCNGLANTYCNQGRLMLYLDRRREAAEAYRQAQHYQQKALESVSAHPSRRQEFVVLNGRLAWLYLLGPATVQDARKALPCIEKILEYEPNHAHHLTLRGVAQFQLGEVEAAMNSFRRSLEINDGTKSLLRNWVSDVYQLRRAAKRDARAAIILNRFFLAKCYHKQGEIHMARDHYLQALHCWDIGPVDDRGWQKTLKEIQEEVALVLAIQGSTINQNKVLEKNPATK